MASTLPDGWKPSSSNQVIGESEADGAFLKAVAAAHGVPEFDFTAPKGADGRALGKDAFKKHLIAFKFLIQHGSVERIVVVGDNDDSHADSLADVRRAIRDAGGYPTPAAAPLQVAQAGKLRVGIVMLPGTNQNGCLETLLLRANRAVGPPPACLGTWTTCSGFPTHPTNNYDKFVVRSVLAASVKSEPNISLQRMWQKTDNPIKAHDPAFEWVAAFLHQMFD